MNYKNYTDAYQAAKKLQEQHLSDCIMVKVVKSSYGGFVLQLLPMDLMIDGLVNRQGKASNNYGK